MKFRNKAALARWRAAAATGSYSASVICYAEAWANLMEARIGEDTSKLNEIARQASYDANTEDITGLRYDCAVRTLIDCWAHGDALRHWHNTEGLR